MVPSPGQQPPPGALPCPNSFTSCINTFMEVMSLGCKGNTDVECFCPKEDFMKKLYDCVFAHRMSDDEFIKVQMFIQGMCAKFISTSPQIFMAAQPIVSVLTVTGTPRYTNADYTTVNVPMTMTNGGSTQVVTNTVAVPAISLPTAVPSTPTGAPQSPGAAGVSPGTEGSFAQPANPVVAPAVRGTGTGGLVQPSATGFPVTAGAGRVGVSVGAGLALMAAVVAVL